MHATIMLSLMQHPPEDALTRLPAWLEFTLLLVVPATLAVFIQTTMWRLLRRVTRAEGRSPTRRLVDRTAMPASLLSAALGVSMGVVLSGERGVAPVWLTDIWPQTVLALVILLLTWLLIGIVGGFDQMILARHRVDVRDNLQARRMHTQVKLISRTLQLIIGLVGAGMALMTFDVFERIGTSMLASAGIAGIVVGFAAGPVLGNLIAGVQIALTQPIRIDDAVVIEGEWGWIEEITATYVVIKIWDQRRLIVPFRKIIEEPFQNWTRNTADILGSVTLYVDYTCPIDPLREELARILDGHPKWDGRAQVLQVIDTTDRVIVLRALMTAADSPTAWELRCDVRERLIAFLQREYPHALPRHRATLFEEEPTPHSTAEPPRPHSIDDPTFDDAPTPPPPIPREQDPETTPPS
jgi:small-conductance mechanosensitive channel